MEKKGTMTAGNPRGMRCDCGGRFEDRLSDFDGLKSPAMVCVKCGEVTLTKVQARRLMRIKELSMACRAKRKVVRIGNSIGITLPEELAKIGQHVHMQPVDEKTIAMTFD